MSGSSKPSGGAPASSAGSAAAKPAAYARRSVAIDAASSAGPYAPDMLMQPMPSGDTWKSVRPNMRRSTPQGRICGTMWVGVRMNMCRPSCAMRWCQSSQLSGSLRSRRR